MNKNVETIYIMNIRSGLFLFCFLVLNIVCTSNIYSQTPGLIIKPASSPGNSVLDPNGDGYVSSKTNGVQLGFTIPPNDDVLQSEIPYASLVKPDPSGDPMAGPSCLYNEIVGTDAAGNNAVMTYLDGSNNFLFRFRIGDYAVNSKAYSILIDTDQKFGFTGINADPNAVPGNPGFEVEVVLETNFGVEVYKVDGTASPVLGTSFSTNPYSSNCQKSVAITTACSTPDYFYDFYIPFSQLQSLGLGITTSTPLRMVALTSMNPHPSIGNNALSDIGGTSATGNIDAIHTSLIETQTPTSASNINTNGVLDRSACPSINTVTRLSTTITGTSTEASGTSITVYVYQSNGTTLIGSGTTTTSGSNWTINVSSLSPSVTLADGMKVKATATASGKGVSYDNCDIETVASCTVQTSIPTSTEVVKISGGKGYSIVLSTRPIGTKIYLYTSNFALRTVSDLKNSVTNPFITTSNPQTFTFECQTGNCFGTDVYYLRFEEPGKCISPYYVSCDYATGGTSNTPTITTSIITTSTTTIQGNGTAAISQIIIYADGNQIATTTSANTAPFAWTATVSNLSLCQVITARQIVSGQCLSNATAGIPVTRSAIKPIISFSGCSASSPVTTISGYSSESNGTTITLYTPNSAGTSLGTTTVSGGAWTKTGLTLTSGTTIVAKVTAGSCLTPSPDSEPVTISTQTNISAYSISISTPVENQTSVSGTISSGSYPVTLKLYVDEAMVGSGITIYSAGNWTVSGLNSFDLAVGGSVKVTLTAAGGCESTLSSTEAIVQCLAPLDKAISALVTVYCANSYGIVTVQNSQSGIIYTPMESNGTTIFGYGAIGTGGNLNLQTYQLTANPTIVKVKASKFPLGSCDLVLSGSISLTVNPSPAAPTAVSPQIYCASGTTTLASLAVTVPSGSTLKWYATSSGGSSIASSTVLINGTTYYAESENLTTGCVSSTRTAVLVQQGNPSAPSANGNQTFCSGATVSSLVATPVGPGTVVWYDASTGGNVISSGTTLINGTTYYAGTTQNSCTSTTRTPVLVSLVAPPTPTFISAVSSACAGSTGNVYTTESGKTDYVWTVSSGGIITSGGTSTSNTVTVTWNISGPQIVSVNYSNGFCSASSPTVSNVNVVVAPTPIFLTSVTNACVGSAGNLYSTDSGNSSYVWIVSAGGSITSGGSSTDNSVTVTWNSSGNQTVSVNYSNGSCSAASATLLNVSVSPTSVGGSIAGSTNVCTGTNNTTLTLSGQTGPVSKWQSATSSDFTTGVTDIANTTTSLTAVDLTQTTFYRAVISDGICALVYSSLGTITVDPLSVGGSISGDASVCIGTNSTILTLSGHVGTVTKWQSSTSSDFSSGLIDIANTTASLTVTNLTQTTYFRAVVSSGVCSSANSSVGIITVVPLSVGGSIAGSANVCIGTNSTTLTLSGHTGTVTKWQSATSSDFLSGLIDIANTTTSLTATNRTQTTYYRAVVTNGSCSSSNSSTATITVDPLSVGGTATATASTICQGSSSSITLTGYTGTIQWQESVDGLSGWANVSGGSGENSATYTTPNLYAKKYYRAEVTSGACSSSFSSITSVTVNVVTGGTIGSDQIIANSGDPSAFTEVVASTGLGTLSYVWQSSTSTVFSNIVGEIGTTYDVPSGLTTTTYYKRITSSTLAGVGCDAESNLLTVTVGPCIVPSINSQPASPPSICAESGTAIIGVSANGSNLTYQWYVDGTTMLSESSIYSGVTTAALTISNPSISLNGKQYKVIVSGACGSPVESNFATLSIDPVSVGGSISGSASVCPGINSTTLTLSGYTGTISKWQSATSSNFTTGLTDIVNTTTSLLATNLTTTTYYRAFVTSGSCAASYSSSAIITTDDNIAPVITCPSNINTGTNSACTYVGSIGVPSVTDNCTASGSITISSNAPVSYPIGTTSVIWTATDAAGNSATCTQLVSISDTEKPTISCPPSLNVNSNDGCNYTGAIGIATATDNCTSSGNIVITSNAPISFPMGTTSVIWTATDAAGNSATCAQQVIVRDNNVPSIVCPASLAVNTNSGCTYTGSIGSPTVSDNCTNSGSIVIANNAPVSFPIGNTSVIWTATDESGNIATCTQLVIVTDIEAPIINCPAALSVGTNNGCTYVGTIGTATASDNCTTNNNIVISNDAPSFFPLGTTIVTWRAVDVAGNSVTCTQTISVSDNDPPIISCPSNLTVGTNNGCAYTGSIGTATATENCTASGSIVITNNAPVTFPVGNTTVTWTATDSAGNSSTCTQIVTVVDNTAPSLSCPTTFTNAANIGCSYTGTIGTATATDNCTASGSIIITNDANSSFPIGNTIVTWRATDSSGNSNTCTQTVTITNTVPTAVSDNYSVLENITTAPTSVTGNVILNDIDTEGQVITVSSWGVPASGSLTSSSSGVFTYVPAIGFTGNIVFTYTLCDACGQCDTGTVTINVVPCLVSPSIPGPIKITK